ncbi:Exocyst complex component Exo70 protein [Dioscorea alata]|uniref:Exocyst complex component Exo70 protein n=1 Tax=Dioscorea alata TaxID=55571 RepID=A0ACB7VY54_DIOAL|nr:Exocyst complex component Exo70 protein [Dioscorea alata]
MSSPHATQKKTISNQPSSISAFSLPVFPSFSSSPSHHHHHHHHPNDQTLSLSLFFSFLYTSIIYQSNLKLTKVGLMERNQALLPQKCSSFSSSIREDKLQKTGRSLSLGSITDIIETISDDVKKQELKDTEEPPPPQLPFDLFSISEDVDKFLHSSSSSSSEEDKQQQDIPELIIQRFTELLEKELAKYDNNDIKLSDNDIEGIQLLDAINRLSKLTSLLSSTFSANPKSRNAINLTGGLLHHIMTFLEEEFYTLLEDSRTKLVPTASTTSGQKPKRPPSFRASIEHDRCVLPTATAIAAAAESNNNNTNQETSTENVERLKRIASEMIAAGYDAECVQVFTTARSNSLDASICNAGFEKISIDEVQRMQWEPLEASIATWIKAFRQAFTVNFPHELELCGAVFSDHRDIGRAVFCNLTRGIIVQFLDFAEAVAMTKKSAEKLFKVLDMYETLRDAAKQMDELFLVAMSSEKEEDAELAMLLPLDLKSEMASAWSRLGEAAVANFCDLESSIKAEAGKTPVPGGAVHPVTRYVINYLTYAFEYNETLEQVFHEHKKSEKPSSMHDVDGDDGHSSSNNDNLSTISNNNSSTAANNEDDSRNEGDKQSPFAVQVMEVMDLLHQNVESKSKLYKDQSLSNIFLMNNGRYVMQKVKGSEEIKKLVGDTWCRKRSAEMRQYHKNYQRETWGRVLACFKDEGLQANGKVMKPVLKERFKSFNGMFEEILKTQSVWVVSDEQLQSELRVSVSAVVVPAYRSFLGRFQQYFSPGRQTEKYIKYAPDDLETFIDDLFDGNAASIVRRRT